MNNISSKIILSSCFLLFVALTNLSSQSSANIATTEIGPGLRNVMTWQPIPKAKSYRIYRKAPSMGQYPSTPINATSIRPVTDCKSIRSIIGKDSIVLQTGLADSTNNKFQICKLPGLDPTSEKYQRFLLLAGSNLKIAQVAGLVFEDRQVNSGEKYAYKIVALNENDQEIGTIAQELSITAGEIKLPPAPKNLVAEAGDNEVLLTWSENKDAVGFIIVRSTTPSFTSSESVNQSMLCAKITKTLQGGKLAQPLPGFLDFQRWDLNTGKPISHIVNAQNITGPTNGVTYYYRVCAVDLLGRAGPYSESVFATPKDLTLPATPSDLQADPDNTAFIAKVSISFTPVLFDVNGHLEERNLNFEVRRFSTSDGNPDKIPSTIITGTLIKKGAKLLLTDNYEGLRSRYGDQTWFYRIRAVDQNGNKSNWSSAVVATLKDMTKPLAPTGLILEGQENSIALKAIDPSPEPDILEFQVLRSVCDYGKWTPCPEDPHGALITSKPCSGPFIYVGRITQDSIIKARQAGHPFFIDKSIPPGSPLCYAYWVKAIDKSGNVSGDPIFPNDHEKSQIICEKMQDHIPPEAAIITGLFARDKSIQIEFIAPPIQDIRGYYFLRAKETIAQQEPPAGSFNWVGGHEFDLDSKSLKIINTPFSNSGHYSCEVIPVEAPEKMAKGSFLDVSDIKPNTVYWYKVIGIDFEGNITPVGKAVAVSTFTYSSEALSVPSFVSLSQEQDSCGIRLSWSPRFDPNTHRGFMVLKSLSASGPFIQIGSLLMDNSIVDRAVVHGKKYWYKIAMIQANGKVSQMNGDKAIEIK